MSISWVIRWKFEMAKKPTKPGIWKLRNGGYFVRAANGMRSLPNASLVEAIEVRQQLSKEPEEAQTSKPFFPDFAVSLLEERVVKGKIESAATRERWASDLKLYLVPRYHGKRVDQIDVNALVTDMARWIRNGKPSFKDPKKTINFAPSTANGILRTLRTICNVATKRFKLPENPWGETEFFPEGRIYTVEEPNSLPPDIVRRFLEVAEQAYPQHYAMMFLGFVTGLRPSTFRALRKHVDVLWASNQLLVRRSNSRGQEIMEKTKTGHDQTITLPVQVMDMLWEHIAALPDGPMRESPFLFPAITGGVRSRSALDKPFAKIVKMLNVPYAVTPRAMRRSFQNLARAAQVEGIVTRSISGHRTEEMQDHYSTVWSAEQQAALQRLHDMVKS